MAEEAIGIAALPDDGLAGVLRVLPPRSLAVARCVCKAWRDIIDGRSLLLPHLLPRSVHGIFINYIDHQRAHLFSRPSSSFSRIDGLLRFMLNADPEEDIWWTVLDHCNGLLLCDTGGLYVCNPAMQRWTQLPQHTTKARYQRTSAYIAFDPVLSVHYEVFLIPDVPEEKPKPADPVVYRKAEQALDATSFSLEWLFSSPEDQASEEDQRHVEPPSTIEKDHDPCHLMKWPPSPWILKVFSSRNGQWEDRSFAREGQPAGTVEDMQLEKRTWHTQLYAVYNNGVLYVHCRGSFIARFSLSNHTYQVIITPAKGEYVAGRSMNEVIFGQAYKNQVRIWTPNESDGQTEWLLKYQCDLLPHVYHVSTNAWIVEEESQYMSANNKVIHNSRTDSSFELNSDNDDDTFEVKAEHGVRFSRFHILGFHPYKEVVFLAVDFQVMAYHLSSSKFQYLGYARPNSYYYSYTNGIYESFVYTPCLIGELSEDDTHRAYQLA